MIQAFLHWENQEENTSHLGGQIENVPEDTDLIILPEMFSSGFTMNAQKAAEPMDGPTMQWMRRTAAKKNAVITGSIVSEHDKRYYNRLIWMQPDGNYRFYDKRHLFRLASEDHTYTGGSHRWVFEWKGWRVFPLICYDLRFPVWSRRSASFDYDLLIYVANWPERRNKAWKTLLPARAVENQSYTAAVNRIGEDGNGIYHSGDSAIYDYSGNTLISVEPGQPGILSFVLNKEEQDQFRSQFPFWKDADHFEFKP